MNLNPLNLLPVPTGPLQISELLPASKNAGSAPIRFSLVIPTYNECENIKNIVKILSHLLDEAIPGDYELIVVDDDSPDGTWEVAHSLMPDYPHLQVMRRQHEGGLSSAVVWGWQAARGHKLQKLLMCSKSVMRVRAKLHRSNMWSICTTSSGCALTLNG